MSSTVYVIDELLSAVGSAMSQRHVDRLLELGVPPAAVDMCGTARIQPDGELYQPDDDGLEVVILPVFDDSQTIDLLAFNLTTPARWWTRTGAHWALGADALDRVWHDEPLVVCRSPLCWLRAGCPPHGLCVLDWTVARRELADHHVAAEDLHHGRELRRRLSVPARHPRILIPRAA